MSDSKRAITADDLTRINVLSDPQISPDGKAFTFISTSINDDNEYISNLFYQSLDDKETKQWSFGDDKNGYQRFSPDGKQIVFQSSRSGLQQLWLLHMDGGEARQLTTFKYGAGEPHWSKDGKYIVFSASLEADDDLQNQTEQTKEDRKKEVEEKKKQPLIVNRLNYKSDSNGFHDNKYTQLVLLDVEKAQFTQLTSANANHGFQDISPDGKQVLFAANLNDDADFEHTNDLYTVDITTKEINKITNGSGVYFSASFSPNGKKIACFGHEYAYSNASLNELYVFDTDTGKRYTLSESWDIELGDAMIGDTRLGYASVGPVWSMNNDRLFFIATDLGATGLYQVDLSGVLELIYKNNNHVFSFSYNTISESFVLGISTPTNPCDFYLLTKHTELIRLTDANAVFLEEVSMSEPEALTITADDGWEVHGWLLKPHGFEEGKKYPFVLEVHGGPHAMYGQTFFHELQLIAAKGYVVLYNNPRGSHGYGQEFVDAVRTDYGGKDYSDLMTAVDYTLENYHFIDRDRLGVTGGSYGGFMTNWIVGHTDRFKAAVTQRSICNWLSFYGVSDIGYFFTKWEVGKRLLEDPVKLWNCSPLKYAENVETPLLILHGELDFRCPIEQGEQLYVVLKEMRKKVEFIRFPDSSHELSRSGKPEMRIERLNHICRWFESYL
jgi:acylaminoacyl-peptidase